jgi:cytochrome c oxidase cbb3-type subunit 3
LSLPAFLAGVSDDYLKKSIQFGRPGRVMPAFTMLKKPEVDAIVAHVRSWQPAGTPAPVPGGQVRGDAAKGKALYASHCAGCHGANGEGGHGTGVTFSRPRGAPILAPALNNPGFLASASDTLIQTTLRNGREGTPMASFLKAGLSERDIDDIVAFVRSFENTATPASSKILASEQAVLVTQSPYDLERTIEKVKTAIGAANLRLIRVQTLDQGFVKEGTENRNQTILYSCDFPFLNEALKIDPRVGLFLPCRVTVVQQGDKVQVMAVNPKRLSRIFNNAELNQLCEKMHEIYLAILEESAL